MCVCVCVCVCVCFLCAIALQKHVCCSLGLSHVLVLRICACHNLTVYVNLNIQYPDSTVVLTCRQAEVTRLAAKAYKAANQLRGTETHAMAYYNWGNLLCEQFANCRDMSK